MRKKKNLAEATKAGKVCSGSSHRCVHVQGRWEEVTTLTTQVSRIEGHGGLYTTAFAFLFCLGAAYEKVLPPHPAP